jgi:hypothetical protein
LAPARVFPRLREAEEFGQGDADSPGDPADVVQGGVAFSTLRLVIAFARQYTVYLYAKPEMILTEAGLADA